MNDPFDLVHPILLSLFLSIWVEIDFHPPLSDFHRNHRRRHRWKPLFQSDSFHPPFYLLHTLSRCPLPRPLRRVYTPSLFLHHDRKKKGEYEWIQIREGLKKGKVVFFFPPMLPSKRLGGKRTHNIGPAFTRGLYTHTHTLLFTCKRVLYTEVIVLAFYLEVFNIYLWLEAHRLHDVRAYSLHLLSLFPFFIISRTFGLVFFLSFFPHFLFCGGAVAVALRGIGQDGK